MKILNAKIIKWTIRILFIVFVLVYTIPFPINKELNAVEIKLDDPSYLETRTIHISGTYRFNLLKGNTFEGQIFVPEYELTSEKMDKVEFIRDADYDYGYSLSYRYEIGTDVDGRPIREYYFLGRIISGPLLYRPVILVYSKNKGGTGGWGSDSGYCIVPSASNREEALEILEKYDIYPPEYYE
jgi:hypothetical protein